MIEALRRTIASPTIVRSAAAMAWVAITAFLFAMLMIWLRTEPTVPFTNEPNVGVKRVTSQFGL